MWWPAKKKMLFSKCWYSGSWFKNNGCFVVVFLFCITSILTTLCSSLISEALCFNDNMKCDSELGNIFVDLIKQECSSINLLRFCIPIYISKQGIIYRHLTCVQMNILGFLGGFFFGTVKPGLNKQIKRKGNTIFSDISC